MNPAVQIWSTFFCSAQIKIDTEMSHSGFIFILAGDANAAFPFLSASLQVWHQASWII